IPETSAGNWVPPKVALASLKRRRLFGVNRPAVTALPSALRPIGPPLSPRVSSTRTGLMNLGVPAALGLLGAEKPTRATSRSSAFVEKTAIVPANCPLVGTPTAQKLWAIAVDGLTVEALGGAVTSPG